MVVALKNADFGAKNSSQRPPWGLPCNRVNTKMLSFGIPPWWYQIIWVFSQKTWVFGHKNRIFCSIKLHFFMLHLCSRLILGSYGPNSMGSSLPHIIRYFGCLRFSGRRPFGWLAGCFMARLPKINPFWVRKMLFTPPYVLWFGEQQNMQW